VLLLFPYPLFSSANDSNVTKRSNVQTCNVLTVSQPLARANSFMNSAKTSTPSSGIAL
jgi:hypothetical protein